MERQSELLWSWCSGARNKFPIEKTHGLYEKKVKSDGMKLANSYVIIDHELQRIHFTQKKIPNI